MKYDVLLNDANTEGLKIKERPFRTYDERTLFYFESLSIGIIQ